MGFGLGVWVEGRAYLVWDPELTKGARQLTYKGLQESCSGVINSKAYLPGIGV